MRITLSAAVTADGFLDDRTPRRLIVSTPEDWAEVHRLRAAHDAIMVGAETLRRDDPALLIRDEALRARRAAAGMSPDIARVSLTASGRLDPSLRFFAADGADRYLFARCELPALASRAAVIRSDEPLTARYVVTELEKRGIRSLFVEGALRCCGSFWTRGWPIRCAWPSIRRCGSGRLAERHSLSCRPKESPAGTSGSAAWRSRPAPCTAIRRRRICSCCAALSRRAAAACRATAATVWGPSWRPATGGSSRVIRTRHRPRIMPSRRRSPKALAAGAELRGAAIYSSMEPCSTRRSEPESCSALIVRHGFARAVIALYEPDRFAACRGALDMRAAGVDVRCYPELAAEVRAINAHVLKA